MGATTPFTTDDELDLDVRFTESGLETAGNDTDDCTNQCTDDGCDDTVGCN